MRFRTVALVALVCIALAGAEATASEAALHWTINGGELSGSETVKIAGGPWTLNWPTLGTTVEVKAEKVECRSTCKISGAGESSGALKFTGVTVTKPTGCAVGNPGETTGTITTNALKVLVTMDPSNAKSGHDVGRTRIQWSTLSAG